MALEMWKGGPKPALTRASGPENPRMTGPDLWAVAQDSDRTPGSLQSFHCFHNRRTNLPELFTGGDVERWNEIAGVQARVDTTAVEGALDSHYTLPACLHPEWKARIR